MSISSKHTLSLIFGALTMVTGCASNYNGGIGAAPGVFNASVAPPPIGTYTSVTQGMTGTVTVSPNGRFYGQLQFFEPLFQRDKQDIEACRKAPRQYMDDSVCSKAAEGMPRQRFATVSNGNVALVDMPFNCGKAAVKKFIEPGSGRTLHGLISTCNPDNRTTQFTGVRVEYQHQ